MFKDRKLLVTGGTGSIGSSICDYFYSRRKGCQQCIRSLMNSKVDQSQELDKAKLKFRFTVKWVI